MAEHILRRYQKLGVNKELKGHVVFLYVLVNTPKSRWTEADKAELKATARKVEQIFTCFAASYAVDLKIDNSFAEGSCDTEITVNSYAGAETKILKSIGWENAALLRSAYKERYGVDEVAICFVLPENGKSFAMSPYGHNPEEYVYVFEASYEMPFVHEICHLFGATDYYYPNAVAKSFEKNIGKSVMLDYRTGYIDEVTAHLIGWKKELSPAGERFLQETAHITMQDIIDAVEEQTTDEPGEIELPDGSVYVGERKAGWPHGMGMLVRKNGETYTGEFEGGVFSGHGTLIFANGNEYEGEFKDGRMNGRGKLTYQHGVYEGEFKDGKISGYGILTFNNGDVYEGEFKDNVFSGRGTYTKEDGTVLKGIWRNGELAG